MKTSDLPLRALGADTELQYMRINLSRGNESLVFVRKYLEECEKEFHEYGISAHVRRVPIYSLFSRIFRRMGILSTAEKTNEEVFEQITQLLRISIEKLEVVERGELEHFKELSKFCCELSSVAAYYDNRHREKRFSSKQSRRAAS